MKGKLTFVDYLNMELPELVKHPDFNPHVMRVVTAITQMTTSELERLDVSVPIRGGK